MRFFALSPEAAGDFGSSCVHGDITERPVKVIKADFEFQFYPHDDLLSGFYIYACTDRLADALKHSSCSGFKIDALQVSFEERFYQWAELHKGEKFPEFLWLKVTGRAGIDDFGILSGPVEVPLIVSERVLNLLKQFKIDRCAVEDYSPQKLAAAG